MTAAILALYMLGADGEGGAQVLSAGATKTISDVSFIAAQNLLAATPDMVSALGLVVQSKTITQPRRASRFWATPAKVSASDGKNCHAVIFDEGHSVTDRRIYDSLKTAMAKRDNNLFLMITTAGDCGTLCHEQHDYISEILDGTHTDELAETTFGIIYTIPDGMDWRDPIAHQAANPAWGITVMPDMIKHECQQAIATPSAQNNFKTKYLCCWVSGAEAFFDMEKWNKCRDTAMRLEDFEGERCFLGLDHASKIDLSAKVYLFPRQENGETHYYAFTKCYLPQATVDSGKNAMYQGWAHQGHLTVHEGERISDFDIIDDIIDDIKTYAVAEIGYDPAKAGAIAEGVMRSGFDEMYEVRQNAMTLSEPLKELQALVNAGRFHHNCPIFDWCAANVEVKEDNNSNIYPRKAGLRRENKVDLIFATLDALVRALFHDEESEWSVYNERGIVFA
jgi:phage terminase large subunit-like protein